MPRFSVNTPFLSRCSSHGVIILAAVAVSVLAACSGGQAATGGAGEPGVASVPDSVVSTKATRTPAGDVNDQRPVARMDSTEADIGRMYTVWAKCLMREGGAKYDTMLPVELGAGKVLFEPVDETEPAHVACASKQPEMYDDRMRRTDPSGYKERNLQWYRCAKAKGYKLSAPDDLGRFGLTEVGPLGDYTSAKITACKQQAFGEK